MLDALQTGELCPCNWRAGEPRCKWREVDALERLRAAARYQPGRLRADGAGGERDQWLRDVRAHEKTVTEGGLTPDQLNDAVRIAATIYAAAVARGAGEPVAAAPPLGAVEAPFDSP